MKLDDVFDRVIFSELPCPECDAVGQWDYLERYSDRGGLWLLQCVDCGEGQMYQEEYVQKYFECSNCGEELEATNWPDLTSPDAEYFLYCPNDKCDTWIDNDNFMGFLFAV